MDGFMTIGTMMGGAGPAYPFWYRSVVGRHRCPSGINLWQILACSRHAARGGFRGGPVLAPVNHRSGPEEHNKVKIGCQGRGRELIVVST
jgi:hypothetical protein